MKPTFLLVLTLCFPLMLHAQVVKTVEITPGNLETVLTADELNSVTNLTVRGGIDARDFKTMRDRMPVLAVVDMSNATIDAYKGPDGPSPYTSDYAADAIPTDAFYLDYTGKPFLQSVRIPLSTKIIGQGAFKECYKMTSFFLPSTVIAIQDSAFGWCSGLTSINIPESVTSIGKEAFRQCIRLTSVAIPSSIDSIQSSTFSSCQGLVSMDIPSSVTYIGDKAFYCCFGLTSVSLPPSLTTLGKYAFSSCVSLTGPIVLPQGLTAIRDGTFANCYSLASVIIPSSVDSIGIAAFSFCKQLTTWTLPPALEYIGGSAFFNCSLMTGPLNLPSTLQTIGSNAFESCSGLTSLTIPSSVYSIGTEAFSQCRNLASIEVNLLFPPVMDAAPYIFAGIDKATTTLHVPYGAKERYANAYGWKDFTTIVEGTNGFLLNTTTLNFDWKGGTDRTIELNASFAWTATADQPWITVTPASGDSSQILTITADPNPDIGIRRSGTITLSAEGIPVQTIHIRQESTPLMITTTPGGLSKLLTSHQKLSTTSLTLTGSMDARDFKTIHDEMPWLVILDITQATIEAFTYYYGTESHPYPANIIPYAHSWNADDLTDYALAGHSNLAIIKLPVSLTAIGYMAFNYCTHLTSIEVPTPVTRIESLTFYNCHALVSVTLPSTLTYIGLEAFYGCTGMRSIRCYAVNPPELDNKFYDVFDGVNKTSCLLYVPYGTKERYWKAEEWGYFENIIEMSGFSLSATAVTIDAAQGSIYTVEIASDVPWTATSDQSWLRVSPDSGTDGQTITLTADANLEDTLRSATVTVSAAGMEDQTLMVSQKGLITQVTEIDQNRPLVSCYPNPFIQQMTIAIANPSHREVSVEFYSMTGQKVISLARALKGDKITLIWNGSNEQGQQVVPGIYLLKVNGEVRKVVKR